MELVLKLFISKEIPIKQYNLVVGFVHQVDSYHTKWFYCVRLFKHKTLF